MGSDATLQTSERFEQDCKMAKSISLTTLSAAFVRDDPFHPFVRRQVRYGRLRLEHFHPEPEIGNTPGVV